MKQYVPLLLFLFLFLAGRSNITDSVSFLLETQIDQLDPPLPEIDLLFEYPLSDVSVCKGPANVYYLTGTTGDGTGVNEGIRVWFSRDLKQWDPVGATGLVWSFENDAQKWQREIPSNRENKQRAVIAPQIHYIKRNFWITYTVTNSGYSGLLRSISGKPGGPYVDISGEKPLAKGSYASLFEDSDGSVYFVWDGGLMHRMNEDLSGFESHKPFNLFSLNGKTWSGNRVILAKVGERYLLTEARWNSILGRWKEPNPERRGFESLNERFDCMVSYSFSLYGPYTMPDLLIPHGGGGMIFQGFDDQLYAVFSGSDNASSPLYQKPALLPLVFNAENRLKPSLPFPFYPGNNTPVIFVSREGNNKNGATWIDAFSSLQMAVDNAPPGAQIWIAKGQYEAPVVIELKKGLSLLGGFRGNETAFHQRDYRKNRVIVDGRKSVKHVISIANSSFIRIDGLTLRGGRAFGGSFQHRYGAGIHIIRGGETIRIVNCILEDNSAEQDGGGLYASIGAAPLVINTIIRNNTAMKNGGGAAVYCNSVNGYQAQFYNCTFENNKALEYGGAVYFDTNQEKIGLLKLVNCFIVRNESAGRGVITIDRTGSLLMIHCSVCFNRSAVREAVISNLGNIPSQSLFVNSIFYQNAGGTLFSIEGEATFSRKEEKSRESKIWVQFMNCLFNGNEVTSLVERKFDRKRWKTTSELNASVMGNKIFDSDPGFTNPAENDYHLLPSSWAREKGTDQFIFPFDADGNFRTSNFPDLGADEWVE